MQKLGLAKQLKASQQELSGTIQMHRMLDTQHKAAVDELSRCAAGPLTSSSHLHPLCQHASLVWSVQLHLVSSHLSNRAPPPELRD